MFTRLIARLARSVEPTNPRRKWNIFFLRACFSLPIFCIALFSYFTIERNLTALTLEEKRTETHLVASVLKERIDRIVNAGMDFSMHPRIRESILRGAWDDALLDLEILAQMNGDVFIDRVILADPEGTIMVAFPEIGTEGKNFAHRDWYRGIMDTGKTYLSEVYTTTVAPQYDVVAAAIPITNNNAHLAAILVLQVRVDHFLEWAQNLEVGEGSLVHIIDQRGRAITRPPTPLQNPAWNFYDEEIAGKLLRGEEGVEKGRNGFWGAESVVAYKPLSRLGWGVVVEQPATYSFASRNNVLFVLVFLFLVAFIANTFFTFLVYRIIEQCQSKSDTQAPS